MIKHAACAFLIGLTCFGGANAKEGAKVGPPDRSHFPFEIALEFSLRDQNNRRVSEQDYLGKPVLVFFGYANCESICSVAMPNLAQALAELGPAARGISPLFITIDPAQDTVDTIGPGLAKWSPQLIGLTGSEDQLAAARAAFHIERKLLFTDPAGMPVYAHSSFIYLFGAEGRLEALMPPILAPERMAEIILAHTAH